jgi:glycosyltransferase involved in cell wall biosynthesis
MLYLTSYIDSFSPVTSEALAAGVIVIATAHGSNAEFIRHGWNGWLVPAGADSNPDLDSAETLLRAYLAAPSAYEDMRRRAADSVPSWDEQARAWERVWSRSKHAE